MLPIVLIIVGAVAARAWILFGTNYMPGINGAYYLVQARSLLERGVLAIPDMPLTFHLQAALAWLLVKLSGMAQAEAIMWAVKLCDAALPPLIAWPVFVLVQRWAKARGQGQGVPLAAAALSCFAWPWLRITGDLQKNSQALVWLAALAMTLHLWLTGPTPRRGVAVLTCVLLLGLTHVGVLGGAIVLLSAVMVVFLSRQNRTDWRLALPWMAAGAGLLILTGTLVFCKFDPVRILRLITALTNPARFDADGMHMPLPPAGGIHAMQWLPSILFALAVVPGLVIAWRRRANLPPADVAIVAGTALTVLALTGPWFTMDKAVRFHLIALVPAVLVAAFATLHIASAQLQWGLIGAVLLLSTGTTLPTLRRGGSAILSDAAMLELQSLAKQVARPERTLVCAGHGLEWWTAWFLHTRIAQASALKPEDWQRYDSVYFVEIKSGIQMPLPPGAGPPPSMPGGPLTSEPIPPSAKILHDGECLKLALVSTPPEFVR